MDEADLSLAAARLMDSAQREQFCYDIVRGHLFELNALLDKLRGQRESTSERDQVHAHVRARMDTILLAASWDRNGFMHATERFVREGHGEGDDCFAPLLVRAALGGRPLSKNNEFPVTIVRLIQSLLK